MGSCVVVKELLELRLDCKCVFGCGWSDGVGKWEMGRGSGEKRRLGGEVGLWIWILFL